MERKERRDGSALTQSLLPSVHVWQVRRMKRGRWPGVRHGEPPPPRADEGPSLRFFSFRVGAAQDGTDLSRKGSFSQRCDLQLPPTGGRRFRRPVPQCTMGAVVGYTASSSPCGLTPMFTRVDVTKPFISTTGTEWKETRQREIRNVSPADVLLSTTSRKLLH